MSIFRSTFEKLATDNLVRSFFRDQHMEGELPVSLAEALASAIRSRSKLYPFVSVEKLKGRGRVYAVFADINPNWSWSLCGTGISDPPAEYSQKFIAEIDAYHLSALITLKKCYIEGAADQIEMFINSVSGPMAEALDNMILYGEGNDMPGGIIPALSEDHVFALSDESGSAYHGQALYDELAVASDLCEKPKYEHQTEFCSVVNRKTLSKLLREIGFKEAAKPEYLPQLLSKLIISDEIADGDVLFGYMKVYHLYERGGYHMSRSSLGPGHFLEGNVSMRGKATFESALAEPECFILANINGMPPTTSAPIGTI